MKDTRPTVVGKAKGTAPERAVRPGFVNNPNVRGDHGVLPNRSSSFRRLDDASAPIVKEGTYLSRRGNRSRDGRTLDMNIANKTILVTGANRGIGRALL